MVYRSSLITLYLSASWAESYLAKLFLFSSSIDFILVAALPGLLIWDSLFARVIG